MICCDFKVHPWWLALWLSVTPSLLLGATTSDSDDAVGRSHWNKALTHLMRQESSSLFANWSYDPAINIGSVGYVDFTTGEFTAVSKIYQGSNAFYSTPVSETWELTEEGIKRHSVNIKIDGEYTDSESGIKGKTAVKNEWLFSRSNTMAVRYVLAKTSDTTDVAGMIKDNWGTIASAAGRANYLSNTGDIYQGFGVITKVIWAKRGVAVGATKNNSEFTMTTTLGFFDNKDDQLSVKPKVYSTSKSSSIVSHTFPADQSSTSMLVPVAYEFASIAGKKIIPNWTRPINQLELHIFSKPGSTYITEWNVSYYNSNREYKADSGSFPAPQNRTLYFPIDASDIELKIRLPGVFSHNYCTFSWHDPINQWEGGRKEIPTYGVWPGEGRCEDMGYSM